MRLSKFFQTENSGCLYRRESISQVSPWRRRSRLRSRSESRRYAAERARIERFSLDNPVGSLPPLSVAKNAHLSYSFSQSLNRVFAKVLVGCGALVSTVSDCVVQSWPQPWPFSGLSAQIYPNREDCQMSALIKLLLRSSLLKSLALKHEAVSKFNRWRRYLELTSACPASRQASMFRVKIWRTLLQSHIRKRIF